VSGRLVQLDGERVVVHHSEAGEFRNLVVVAEAFDVLEEVLVVVRVSRVGVPVPRVDERRRGHRGAIGERPTVSNLDLKVLGVNLGDRLSNLVVHGAIGVVVDQTGPNSVDDATAAHLIGSAGDQRVFDVGAGSKPDGRATGSDGFTRVRVVGTRRARR